MLLKAGKNLGCCSDTPQEFSPLIFFKRVRAEIRLWGGPPHIRNPTHIRTELQNCVAAEVFWMRGVSDDRGFISDHHSPQKRLKRDASRFPHAGMADGESLMASTPAPATEEKMINGFPRSLVAQRLLRRLLRSLISK